MNTEIKKNLLEVKKTKINNMKFYGCNLHYAKTLRVKWITEDIRLIKLINDLLGWRRKTNASKKTIEELKIQIKIQYRINRVF